MPETLLRHSTGAAGNRRPNRFPATVQGTAGPPGTSTARDTPPSAGSRGRPGGAAAPQESADRLPGDTGKPVAGLVLAAGGGRRIGTPKALLRTRGELFVERAVRVLRQAGCSPVAVVLGAAATTVTEHADLSTAEVVHNADWTAGMGTSLRAGLRALSAADPSCETTGTLVLPVDMPAVTAAAARRVAGYAAPEALVAACYYGQRGHPVLLGRRHWSGVRELAVGDRGARDYLRAHGVTLVPCEDIASGYDIDRPEDLTGE